jgi:hypothetical protein
VAKPPAGSSLLFGALADSGRIKERKNGSYRMVLKGIDDIDWFTDRPDRVAGEWSPKKLVKEWDVLFSDGAPNAQATFEMGSMLKLVTFEMLKPKLSDANQTLSFKVRGIGEKNKDLLTGLKNKRLSNASLFIDDGTTGDKTVTMKVLNNSQLKLEIKPLSPNTVLGDPADNPIGASGYTNPELDEGDIIFTGGEGGAEGVFEFPVTLKNGLQEPSVEIDIVHMEAVDENFLTIPAQCSSSALSQNGPTTVYYSIDGGATQSVEATC